MYNNKKNQSANFLESNLKQDVVSITYEEIGLFPRSFSRVLDRFLKQVFLDVENLVIQEYRFYRYLFLTTLKCILILFIVPFFVNFLAKNYLVRPLTEYFWNTKQTEIFLNSYQQKRAFAELKDFEEKLYFESLTLPKTLGYIDTIKSQENTEESSSDYGVTPKKLFSEAKRESSDEWQTVSPTNFLEISKENMVKGNFVNKALPINYLVKLKEAGFQNSILVDERSFLSAPQNSVQYNKLYNQFNYTWKQLEANQQRLQEKTIELAVRYNNQSIEAMTNFFADLISFMTLFYLLFVLEIQINITKSFLLEVFFGLDDSKKSLLILLVTDLLVGYHSSNIWELFFEFLLNHYGLPESQTGIFLLVATLPVLLDVLFKYLIFRHLNRSSPATVATYHAMIE
nr:chloroplast enveloppe membrane protein [Borodinellopsis texensis]